MESYRVGGWWVVHLDYSVSSGPFLRFSMRFEFLSEMFDHSVCETRYPSLTINTYAILHNCTVSLVWTTTLYMYEEVVPNYSATFSVMFSG